MSAGEGYVIPTKPLTRTVFYANGDTFARGAINLGAKEFCDDQGLDDACCNTLAMITEQANALLQLGYHPQVVRFLLIQILQHLEIQFPDSVNAGSST